MKKSYITFFTTLLFFCSFHLIAQKTIFIDSNFKEITLAEYEILCNSKMNYCPIATIADSLIVKKVVNRYTFGKLTEAQNNQLRSILHVDSNKKLKIDTPIVIQFIDSFAAFNPQRRFSQQKQTRILDSFEVGFRVDSVSLKESLELHNSNNKKKLEKLNKCYDVFAKKTQGQFAVLYSVDNTGKFSNVSPHILPDRGIFKKLFFRLYRHPKTLIINPNGEYLLCGSFENRKLFKLLNTPDWSEFKEDLAKSYEKNRGVGIFKKPYDRGPNCFIE